MACRQSIFPLTDRAVPGTASNATPIAAPQEGQNPDQSRPSDGDDAGVSQEAEIVTQKQIARELPPTMDTARLLRDVPGVSTYEAGGVSGLPAIHRMADDRLNILIGGVQTTSACANHINPPLSYIGPANVERIEVYSGVMPVSKGGDSIGGTIIAEPKSPVFAPQAAKLLPPSSGGPQAALAPLPFLKLPAAGSTPVRRGRHLLVTGMISSFFRGNNNGISVSGTANVATNHWSLLYNGDWQRATNYHAGGAGKKILSTNFIAENHSGTLAYQNDGHYILAARRDPEHPHQGFPNQRMDMTGIVATQSKTKYKGLDDWGSCRRARLLEQRQIIRWASCRTSSQPTCRWPRSGQDYGYSVKAEIPLRGRSRGKDILRVGSEFHGFQLNDWWEPTGTWRGPTPMTMTMPPMMPGGMPMTMTKWMMPMNMMGPLTFWNINNGRRNRLGHYVEWDAEWNDQWSSLLGFRNDTVWFNTGPVSPYDWRDPLYMESCKSNMMTGGPDCSPRITR